MTLAATFLGGAQSRLLPPSLPFRFFGAAAIFHVLMWLALLTDADDAMSFRGGLAPTLAAVHLLTLGVFTATAIGAGVQLLPVATRRAFSAVWAIKLTFWLTIPGLTILAAGMYAMQTTTVIIGAAVATTGLVVFAVLFADNLRHAGSLPVVAAYGWTALAALVALVTLGVALAIDYEIGFLPDHAAVALAHVILGGFGFMGMLALGFSHILVPMFALAPAPNKRESFALLVLTIGALGLGTIGALLTNDTTLAVAGLLGIGAAGGHVRLMFKVLAAGMRKRLGLSFVLVRAAWAILPTTLAVGIAALYGYAGPNGPTLFGVLLLGGWLLTFLLGILQRIVPFLASMHMTRPDRGGPPLLSELAGSWPLKLHAACHGLAIAGLTVAIAVDNLILARLAAAVGLLGAVAFAWFMTGVIALLIRSSTR